MRAPRYEQRVVGDAWSCVSCGSSWRVESFRDFLLKRPPVCSCGGEVIPVALTETREIEEVRR